MFIIRAQVYHILNKTVSNCFFELDVSAVAAFKLQTINDGLAEYLWLLFEPHLMETRQRAGRYIRATKHLVEMFFMIEQENLFGENDEAIIQNDAIEPTVSVPVENDNDAIIMDYDDSDADDNESENSDELPVKIIDDLYQQLRESHRDNKYSQDYTDEYIQHKDLRPKLTNYQIDGVKWMLNRETSIDHFPTEFTEVARRWQINGDDDDESETKFFYNDRTMVLMVNKNDDVPIPSGGILADAMGLGKTVEMLDLILLNRRHVLENHQHIQMDEYREQNAPQELRCLCSKRMLSNTVQCSRCFMLQHRACVSQRDTPTTPDAQYKCPTCWQTEPPLEAKTTFIVSPTSIKLQWRDEVIKHVSDENFKVSND